MEAMPASLLVRAGSRARSSKDLHNQSGMFPRHSVVLSFGQRPARPFAWPDAHSIAGRSAMSATLRVATLLGTLALGACAVGPPAGPSVAALPGKDKSLEAFQQDDAACRQYAAQTLGGVSPADAANQSMANSAVAGTLLGAAAGAAIGAAAGNPAAGAAIGAGSGRRQLFRGLGAAGLRHQLRPVHDLARRPGGLGPRARTRALCGRPLPLSGPRLRLCALSLLPLSLLLPRTVRGRRVRLGLAPLLAPLVLRSVNPASGT